LTRGKPLKLVKFPRGERPQKGVRIYGKKNPPKEKAPGGLCGGRGREKAIYPEVKVKGRSRKGEKKKKGKGEKDLPLPSRSTDQGMLLF